MTPPLAGVRVADFSWFGAGPIAARTLADFGAEVVRVESEARVDGLRVLQPIRPGATGYNASGYFNNFNAGKRSLLLNMGSDGAHAVAMRLIRWADVFLINVTPRVVEKWWMDYASLSRENPRLVAVYAPMQGMDGPRRDYLGFGAVLTPVTGISHLTGFPNRPPFGVGTNYPDFAINPGHQVIAILAALRHRERSGHGQMIELAQTESVAATLGPTLLDYSVNGRVQARAGNRSSWMAPHGAFRCLDEARNHPPAPGQAAARQRWIAIAVGNDAEWEALCQVAAGKPFTTDARFATIAGRKQHEDALEEAIGAWTRPQRAYELAQRLQDAGTPAGVVHDAQDMLEHDAHMQARGYYARLDHAGTGPATYDGPVAQLHGTPAEVTVPAPLFGEHTFDVATRILGYSEDEVAELLARGVLT